MTPIDQQSTALLYGFWARTSGAEKRERIRSDGDKSYHSCLPRSVCLLRQSCNYIKLMTWTCFVSIYVSAGFWESRNHKAHSIYHLFETHTFTHTHILIILLFSTGGWGSWVLLNVFYYSPFSASRHFLPPFRKQATQKLWICGFGLQLILE